MIRSKYFDESVSRETFDNILKYHSILLSENAKMALISKSSEEIAFQRHYEDSAQVIEYIEKTDRTLLDVGSGAGLPGIILDIIKKDHNLDFSTHLVEKSPKKCKFLSSVNSLLDLSIKIHNSDVREMSEKNFDVVVSRAFKPMKDFFNIISDAQIKFGKIILMKGEKFMDEFLEAKKYFEINCEYFDSITNKASKVFVIKGVVKKNMTKIISIINQKGGVGKTTSTVNLGYALASAGKKILVIDLDPQGNASTGLGIEKEKRQKTIYEFLVDKNEDPKNFILKTETENLDIICANVELSGFETEVAEDNKRAFYLKDVLDQIKQKNQYNQILIDCPPSLSLLTIMALVASDTVIIPLQTEFFALEGVSQLIKTIERVKENLNRDLDIQGVILTMYDRRNRLSGQVENEARKYFGEKVYKTVIPRNVRISEAPSHGVPVMVYDKSSAGAIAYKDLCNEILNQGHAA